MKYIKRLALNRKNQTDNRFAVEADDRIVTTSKRSLQLPAGTTGNRPSGANGAIRFNTLISETEIYNIDKANTNIGSDPWEIVKTNRQSTITPQNLGIGYGTTTVFGPLAYQVDTSTPQNIMVFIDNVYQIPTTNYTLVDGSTVVKHVTLSNDINPSDTILTLSSIEDILVGQTVTAPSGLPGGSIVTEVNTTATQVTISPGASGTITSGTNLTFAFYTGTFIKFNGYLPAKPVFALLGIDGYAP